MKISYALVGLTSEYITCLECTSTRDWESKGDLEGSAFFLSLFNSSVQISECMAYIKDVVNHKRTVNDDIILDYWSLHIYNPICEVWEKSRGAENLYCKIHINDIQTMLEILVPLWREFEATHIRVVYKVNSPI